MYGMMVVDDEPIVRLAVKSLIDWEEHGFTACYEAANGRQALKLLEEHPEIDIIITDINMPVMDGLSLIEAVQKINAGKGIIVLSAYNDYQWVRQAFKLGVKDYILKTEMNAENILTLLQGVVKELEEHREQNKVTGSLENRESRYIKEKILRDSIYSITPNLSDQISRVGIRLKAQNIVLCFIWIDDYKTVSARYNDNSLKLFIDTVVNAIDQVLDAGKVFGEILLLSPEEYVLLLSFPEFSQMQIREKILEILGQIKHSLINYLNIHFSTGVSKTKDGFPEIPGLLREAEANARLRFIFGKGRIIFPEDAVGVGIGEVPFKGFLNNHCDFLDALKEMNQQRVIQELKRLLSAISTAKTLKKDKGLPYYMELIFILASFLHEKGDELSELLGTEEDVYSQISSFETQTEINDWIEKITLDILDNLRGKKEYKGNRAIARAQEFIRSYYQQDLTLKMVSDYVGLSESHFSYLFTKITGQCFIDYLTGIRLQKAKELLMDTSLKIYEIGLAVGYNSIEHFSRVFKKSTGFSPNHYRIS
jgi:two-component system, response regulator YesN